MRNTRPRPTILIGVQRELWARSAGRCEFRGCNKLLFRDNLTKKRSNLGRISHIIAFSPNGPRGHAVLSERLEKDIFNLMLTCGDHAKIIDDKDKVADYAVDLLQSFKREHESRVRALTGVQEEAKASVLIVKGAVNTRLPAITEADAFSAMLPLYPAEENATVIDLGTVRGRLTTDDITHLARELADDFQRKRVGELPVLAVFAIAPVPILVELGCLLGDLTRVHLFQRHRAPDETWTWPKSEAADGDFYDVILPNEVGEEPIALVLSISEAVAAEFVQTAVPGATSYEIRAQSPGRDFLRSSARLAAFGQQLRTVLAEIRVRRPELDHIHLFAAVPAPAAVEFGRHLHGMDASVIVYEFNEPARRYDAGLTITRHREAT